MQTIEGKNLSRERTFSGLLTARLSAARAVPASRAIAEQQSLDKLDTEKRTEPLRMEGSCTAIPRDSHARQVLVVYKYITVI